VHFRGEIRAVPKAAGIVRVMIVGNGTPEF
jgi:hypothetical protein